MAGTSAHSFQTLLLLLFCILLFFLFGIFLEHSTVVSVEAVSNATLHLSLVMSNHAPRKESNLALLLPIMLLSKVPLHFRKLQVF